MWGIHFMNTFFEKALVESLKILLHENEGVIIETPKTDCLFDKKSIVLRYKNGIVVDPYIGTAEPGEIVAVSISDDDDDPLLSSSFLETSKLFLQHLPSPRSL